MKGGKCQPCAMTSADLRRAADKLSPCPFCGGKAYGDVERGGTRSNARNVLRIGCQNDDCIVRPIIIITWVGDSRADHLRPMDEITQARAAWNKRPKRAEQK